MCAVCEALAWSCLPQHVWMELSVTVNPSPHESLWIFPETSRGSSAFQTVTNQVKEEVLSHFKPLTFICSVHCWSVNNKATKAKVSHHTLHAFHGSLSARLRVPDPLGGGRRVTRMRRGVSAAERSLPRKRARVHAQEARPLHLILGTATPDILLILLMLSTVSVSPTVAMAQMCKAEL